MRLDRQVWDLPQRLGMSSLDKIASRRSPVRISNAAVLMLGLLIAGCGTDRILGGSNTTGASAAASSSPSLKERLSNFFSNRSAESQAQASSQVVVLPPDFDCPTVDIRTGTSTYAVSAPGVDPSAMSLRYQATIGQTARDCRLAGNTLTMKVGLEGRVILGPAGGPGQMDVPLRIAVVREGPEPKTILTRLRWFTVTIPPGELNVLFTQIEDDLSFPMPRGPEIDAYVVYIGFDRAAVKELEKKKPAKKPPAPRRPT